MQSPSNLLKINGVACPCPMYGIEIIKSVVVDSGRNAKGEVVGQKIGRTLYKLNNLEWRGLTIDEWDRIELSEERDQGIDYKHVLYLRR